MFMGAIEEITSATRTIYREVEGAKRKIEVKVWNDTLANLSLMALGSSAPEILLSLLELLGRRFYSGKLGSSTIVGSAAFNLFAITAVCILAIPAGEVRFILQTDVYLVTLTFSLFAYVWILIIVQVWTPEVITLIEGILTFLMFFILLLVSYMADIGMIRIADLCEGSGGSNKVSPEDMPSPVPVRQTQLFHKTEASMNADEIDETREVIAKIVQDCTDKYGHRATEAAVQRIIKLKATSSSIKSRAYYRVNAVRNITASGKGKTASDKKDKVDELAKIRGQVDELIDNDNGEGQTQVVEFATPFYSCLESDGTVECDVVRAGPLDGVLKVQFQTRDGTATAGEDYVTVQGELVFEAGEESKTIAITIIDDDYHEPDEDFFIDLMECSTASGTCRLGEVRTAVITIVDDDEPGVLSFSEDDFYVTQSGNKQTAVVWVTRKDGCSANVSCAYRTQSGSAKAGVDYTESEGRVTFKKGEVRKSIEIPVSNDVAYTKDVSFSVYLDDAQGGAKFCADTLGGAESCITHVHISADEENRKKIASLHKMITDVFDSEEVKIGRESWQEQFISALYVNGSEEDQREAGVTDWIFHILSLPFKVIFAFTPPPVFLGGWAAFFVSLTFIGVLTGIVGDAATIFGCSCGIPDEITAITFVALGTSLPDTFASKTAAMAEPFADASVGNVTGSNSVNVFLGLGIAWTLGAIHWAGAGATEEWKNRYRMVTMPDGTSLVDKLGEAGGFHVKAGSLGFSVAVYVSLAFVGSAALAWRRVSVGGELGGPKLHSLLSALFFFGLWIAYILANIVYFILGGGNPS
jgi:solute carrier family 8 (sodium/calcium exchanger)